MKKMRNWSDPFFAILMVCWTLELPRHASSFSLLQPVVLPPSLSSSASSSSSSASYKRDSSSSRRLSTLRSSWLQAAADSTALSLDDSASPLLPMQPVREGPFDTSSPKVGVLLLNLGGPETGDDVEGFLYNLFADPDIIQLPPFLAPLQGLIAYFVAKRRAPKSRAAYESIGGGSPILRYSNAQAKLLCEEIQKRYGLDVKAYIGMRYWQPFTEDALEKIRRDNIEALVIVPLYPQFSVSTSGSSLRVLQEEFSKHGRSKYQNMVHTVIPSWYRRPGYIRTMAQLIQTELDAFTQHQIDEALRVAPNDPPLHILFSAHGVPRSYVEAGDPYQQQIEECVGKIGSQLLQQQQQRSSSSSSSSSKGDAAAAAEKPQVRVHLSYQSRVGPIEWLRPYTDDVLPALGAQGVRNLVVVPISFVSEHIETLEEIDIEYRELAEESGITNWRRCPALNTDPNFIRDMADMVMEALQEPIQTVTEACVANMVSNIEPEDRLMMITTATGVQGGVGGVGAKGSLHPHHQQQQQQQQEQQAVAGTREGGGRLNDKERLTVRAVMLGVLVTVLIELANGKSLVQMFGNN